MRPTLKPVLSALGYDTSQKQLGMVKLLQAAGAFGKLPGVTAVINDRQAEAILDHVTFEDVLEASEWLRDKTQETMLRPDGQLRMDTQERADLHANRDVVLTALKETGQLSNVTPPQQHYDHVLVLGAMEDTSIERIQTIKQLWDEGVRFDNIHLLGSERSLNPEKEPIATIPGKGGNIIANEADMLTSHYSEISRQWPDELQQTPVYGVTSYNQGNHNANTKNTAETWLSLDPNPAQGNVLVISNQPYIAYQDAAVKSALPDNMHVDTVGAPAKEKTLNLTVAMDSIARQIDVNFDKMVALAKKNNNKPDFGVKSAEEEVERDSNFALLRPDEIQADPETYQFRFDYDKKSGATESHRFHEDKWNPAFDSKPLLIHERLDGTYFVADGHHRLELAQRLNAEGKPPKHLAVHILREADGYSARDVKIIAAYKNFAEHKVNPLEAATVLKEVKEADVHQHLIPYLDMHTPNLQTAYQLSNLSSPTLNRVIGGEFSIENAAYVGEHYNDTVQQDAALEVMSLQEKPVGTSSFADRVTAKKEPKSFAQTIKKPGSEPQTHVEQLESSQNMTATETLPPR